MTHMTPDATMDDAAAVDDRPEGFQDLSPEERLARVQRFVSSDYLLTDLVDMANHGVSLPVTLSVQGQLVTGRLASALDYFDQVEQDIREVPLGRLGEAVRSRIRASRPPTEGSALVAAMPPMYVHLVNARYVSRQGEYLPPQGTPALIWRGKIAAVDGFSIGECAVVR